MTLGKTRISTWLAAAALAAAVVLGLGGTARPATAQVSLVCPLGYYYLAGYGCYPFGGYAYYPNYAYYPYPYTVPYGFTFRFGDFDRDHDRDHDHDRFRGGFGGRR